MKNNNTIELEKLISNRGNKYRLLAYILVLVMIVGSLVACLPSKLPTQCPTTPKEGYTLPPEEDLTLPPKEGPTLPPSVTVKLSDKVDNAGVLLEDVKVISGDGIAVLYLAKGTRALDESGKPLNSITVTAGPPQRLFYEHYLYGLAYDFSPRGARFDPPAQLTISYDPLLLIYNADEDKPQIGYFELAKPTWIWLNVTADFNIHYVTAEIKHLGTFVLSFEVFEIWFPTS